MQALFRLRRGFIIVAVLFGFFVIGLVHTTYEKIYPHKARVPHHRR